MPKPMSDHERELTKKAIVEQAKKLIRTRGGIKTITVDDIVRAAGMAKGSFYSYFKSKEECLYEVIQSVWLDRLNQCEMIMQENPPMLKSAEKFVREVLYADDISRYIKPADVDMLLRKLPFDYCVRVQQTIHDAETQMMAILNLDKAHSETVHLFIACLEFTAMEDSASNTAKTEVADALIVATAEYIDKNKKI